jgi:hypothetical protein
MVHGAEAYWNLLIGHTLLTSGSSIVDFVRVA